MPLGFISYYNRKEHYGFIDCPELNIDQIFFHQLNCVDAYKNIYKGDKVLFEYGSEIDYEAKAENISFIQNATLESLKSDFRNGMILNGFLKKVGETYYVKDLDNYIFIPLIIAKYETDIEDVYERKINELIEYKIITFTKSNKIRAININRRFLVECEFLKEKEITEAQILAKVKGGYEIKVFDKINAFLPNSLALKNRDEITIGDFVKVICIKSDKNLENVIFDLHENLEIEIAKAISRKAFEESLLPGDRFSAKIKAATGFGIFVGFGLSEGLVHISNIIKRPIDLLKDSRKQFSKSIEKVFRKGQEVDVIFVNRDKNLISLNWDEHSDNNKSFYQSIIKELIELKNAQEQN